METGNSSENGSSVGQCATISIWASGTSIAVSLSYGILIPLIVFGNGLVVIGFVINHKLRTATNIFICGLGLSDLLIGLFSVPYWTYISSLDSLMDAYCTPSLYTVYICIDIWTGCASILQLTSIAIERLYFTVAPLRHRRLPRSIYWYMLGVAWFYSTFMAVLQPLQRHWQKEYSVFLMVTCFIFPLFIIVSVYLYILKIGRRQVRKKPSTRTRMGSTGGNFKEFNIFITVIVITGVFVIAWTPFFVVTVVASLCSGCISHPEHDPLVRFVKWTQYSSSAINPYIYAYRNEEVRNTFKRILRLCFCGCGVGKRFTKKPKSARSSRPSSIEQGAEKPVDDDSFGDGYNSGTMDHQTRRVHGHYPRIIDIDELISHAPRSITNTPRDSKHREANDTEQHASSPIISVHVPSTKKAHFYESNGFVEMQTSTRDDKERHKEINRHQRKKGIDNEAYLWDRRTELSLERHRNEKYSNSYGSKRQPNLSRESRRSTNQTRAQNSRDAQIDHIATCNDNETSDKSTNQIRVHRSRDEEANEVPRIDRIMTCNDNETSDEVFYV